MGGEFGWRFGLVLTYAAVEGRTIERREDDRAGRVGCSSGEFAVSSGSEDVRFRFLGWIDSFISWMESTPFNFLRLF